MKRIGNFLLRGLSVIIILALLLIAGGAYYFKSYLPKTVAPKSFPKIDGELQLDGLNAPVDIYRDKMGIPHIYADDGSRPVLRPGLCPCPGALLANGFLPACRRRPDGRNVR